MYLKKRMKRLVKLRLGAGVTYYCRGACGSPASEEILSWREKKSQGCVNIKESPGQTRE